jgi:non-specific serine/threonine protein kinase/serine/threonine-protein kinase
MSDEKNNPTVAARVRLRPAAQGIKAPLSAMVRDGSEWIGPFRLTGLLGEGGMGSVFLAEQREPVRRNVALKLMRSSITSNLALARFSAERQALARLSHPNIAAMYEAGTTADGFPYFAMEHIEGETLTRYCEAHRLSIRQRLELFRQLCDAVQHAHQKGIIHRDLKPSNVLVTEVEGRAVPKVIDFGIAKAVDQPLTEATLWTGDGIVGTPAYMSPEALNGVGDDLDTRSDIYSLGVMLYELVAGVRPRDTEGVAMATLMRQVAEEETPTLRARFRQLSPERRLEIAAARQLDVPLLDRAFAGDLTWIIGKATARDRELRYVSAADFAADIARHLADEPVLAGAPTWRYRTSKFIRRHRAMVVAASLIFLAIIGGVIGTTTAMFRAQRAQSEAEAESLFLTELFEGANPWNRQKETTVRELLDEAALRIPTELKGYPASRAELLLTIGTSQFHLGHLERAESLLREALRVRIEVSGADSPLVARIQNVLALVRDDLGDSVEAEKLLRDSIVIRENAYGRLHPAVARGLFDLSNVLQSSGKLVEAEKLNEASLRLRRVLQARGNPDVEVTTVAMTVGALAEKKAALGKTREAEAMFRESLAMRDSAGDRKYGSARTMIALGDLLSSEQRNAEAEAMYREAVSRFKTFLDAKDLRLANATTKLAHSLRLQKKVAESERLLTEALAILDQSDGTPSSVEEARVRTKRELELLRAER